MLPFGSIVLLSLRFLNVSKFTTITPLLLLILCKLSFPVVVLKMSSLPTLALKSPLTKFSHGILGVYETHVPIAHGSRPKL
jgi:hypothetical protein